MVTRPQSCTSPFVVICRLTFMIPHQYTSFIFFNQWAVNIELQVQRLIADDKEPIDFRDLRKHTQYYGGFHDNHRVISWLWDILENDLNNEEKRLFLKVSALRIKAEIPRVLQSQIT